ncbi:non-canonical purine NTP pyrophosphatase [Fructobacillus papyrifericola]|uniref:Xanthosine triphosphate pyrophosphatase n=1 Tax=Fructobacillus papyrifericola TaxID=2713172 RepID=A0ABS5QRR9_9LACO|nr:non-canonical purine NTP pyrophosphatase [Fructobacillus papyrifericola]MBS9335905.1 xanthosine triphosphate pyrophosphatase [Fructobacillus papyrifericola]
MRLVFASNNGAKTRELALLAKEMGQEIVSYKDVLGKKLEFPAESTDNQVENAKQKANFIHGYLPDEWILSDDTGFYLEAFPNRFGVTAAREFRESGLRGIEQENAYILDLYKDIPDEKRGAYLLATMALCSPEGELFVAAKRGGVAIAREPKGGPELAGLTDLLLAENGKTLSSMPLEEAVDYHDRSRTLKALLDQVAESEK